MQGISLFLERFKHLMHSNGVAKEIVVKVFLDALNVKLEPSDISYKKNILSVKSYPALKTEILIRKKTLIEKLKENGLHDVVDIK